MMETWTFGEAIKYYCKNPYRGYDYDSYVNKHNVKALVNPVIKVAKEYAYFTTSQQIDEYDFSILPDTFVVKGTHGCGWTIIVNNNFNESRTISNMKFWLTQYYRGKFERQYMQLIPGVLIEEYLGELSEDFRFWMFSEKMILIEYDTYDDFDEHGETARKFRKRSFYDKDWNFIPVKRLYPYALTKDKPENLEEMKQIVYKLTKIAKNPPFVRVDIAIKDNELYFGEYTFTPTGGQGRFDPAEYEKRYGTLIRKI